MGECVINTVSENMVEAVNTLSLDAPYEISKWEVSGLTEAPTTAVKPASIKERVLSIEHKIIDINEVVADSEGTSIAGLVLNKATRFWVREDEPDMDANHIHLGELRPIVQLGGKYYGRIVSTFQLTRGRWSDKYPKSDVLTKLEESGPPQ